jgi:hypothetical protein
VPDLSSFLGHDGGFLIQVIKVVGMSGLLFVVWYLQRKSEDRRLTLIMREESKKWTQKFQEEREYRQQKFDDERAYRENQFKIFLNLMENVQTHTAMLNTIVNLLHAHPRMFDDLGDKVGLTSDGINVLHRRIDQLFIDLAAKRGGAPTTPPALSTHTPIPTPAKDPK